jgi:asparagine synthase (glutamine-hydrolysing)
VCGIAGVLDAASATTSDRLTSLASAMTDTLRHRGPDDGGVWVDPEAGIALGNRRLAVVDLSPAGHQPMRSASGHRVMVFNGEIYNHQELRRQLSAAGHGFRGGSDTEVLLAAVEEWGLPGALGRANGMFALALWDHDARALHLARDRIGEKPLYYGWAGSHLVFGSELKALVAHPDLAPELDRGALALYLRWTHVPAPHCIYRDVFKLPPGTTLTFGPDATSRPGPIPYWSLAGAVDDGAADRFTGDVTAATDELESLLLDAVRCRMTADVPVGAFLSGGVDSSTVVALMVKAQQGPVRTFTITMPEAGMDEGADAMAVASVLGTEHHPVELSVAEALDAVPLLPDLYDEPFGDPSQLPTLLVSRVARQHVTVALSGDGGDEVFGGYNRYVLSRYAWRRARFVPAPLRSLLGRAILSVPPRTWDALFDPGRQWVPRALRMRNPGDKAHKLAALLAAGDASAVYPALAGLWGAALPLAQPMVEPSTVITERAGWPRAIDMTEEMMFLDTAMALPDGMLTKVDRASMGVSLEARLPLLDHRLIEFAWRLPLDLKVRRNQGKWLLRQVLHRHVPSRLVDRPKMGFDPPVAAWLRGPLRSWGEDLLDSRSLRDDGWLDEARIRALWAEHQSGARNWDRELWAILMLQAWLHAT